MLVKGIVINNNAVQVTIDSFICDAPARAYTCNIKGHTGYFGCGKCTQEGSYVENIESCSLLLIPSLEPTKVSGVKNRKSIIWEVQC